MNSGQKLSLSAETLSAQLGLLNAMSATFTTRQVDTEVYMHNARCQI